MQTFLPVATTDYSRIAKVLDNKRLNKQALEGWQIMLTLLELDPQGNYRKPKGWVNHPAVKMWRGCEVELWKYVIAMTNEWIARGYKSTIGTKATETIKVAFENHLIEDADAVPAWASKANKLEEIASSHRRALLNKDYDWYSQFGWGEDAGTRPESYEYVWE
jgi:hypothetical protein